MKTLSSFVMLAFTFTLIPKIGIGQTSSELDAALQKIATTSLQKCPALKELADKYAAEGKSAEAFSVRGTIKNVCECVPTEINKLLQSPTWKKLKESFSESEFKQVFKSSVAGKCGAEQIRFSFGDGCANHLPSNQPNREKYCSCMREKFGLLADADVADLGIDFNAYLPKAAEAKKNRLPPPAQSPHVKRFFSIDEACKSN